MAENQRVCATHQSILLPDRQLPSTVGVPRRAPCVTILIHGVNDVGEAYPVQEAGLCAGLNQRLDRADLQPASYRLPPENRADMPLLDDPDAVYYRRQQTSNSETCVIPFYWGYREQEGVIPGTKKPYINTHENDHGQWTDRYGNRLDKKGAKNGGTFDNATACLPPMWGRGHSGTVLLLDANRLNDDATHPVLASPPRGYMLLAARRLAMLLKNLRAHPAPNGNGKPAGKPNDTINIVAHSQGCLISLLAHAFLQQDGVERGADVLVMNDPPYGLGETLTGGAQEGIGQNTTRSRIETLANIIGWMTHAPNARPAFAALADACGNQGRAGMRFAIDAPERDNRGSVFLYFCPMDQTVSLASIQGIGWQGVPAEMEAHDANDNHARQPVLARLGARFFQRVFTNLLRDGQPERVGTAPHPYPLRQGQEPGGPGRPVHEPLPRETRQINAPALKTPVIPRLGHGGKVNVGPIDAAIAITDNDIAHPGIRTVEETLDKPACLVRNWPGPLDHDECWQLEHWYNTDKLRARSAQQEIRIIEAALVSDRRVRLVRLVRRESPDEARRRWQSQEVENDSYHSAIVTNHDLSRDVTAYDLAVGKAEAIDDDAFYAYLCLIADWRVKNANDRNYKDLLNSPFYAGTVDKDILDANIVYYTTGELPPAYRFDDEHAIRDPKTGVKRVALPIPPLVDADTVNARNRRIDDWSRMYGPGTPRWTITGKRKT